jgi:hypothetical protein
LTTAALVSVVLILLILGGLPIFLALGVAGMAGLFMVRGSAALSLAPTSFFGQLSSFEMIALPLWCCQSNANQSPIVPEQRFFRPPVRATRPVRRSGGL